MARTGRQTRSFNIIRRGPLFADEFHYSLEVWQLSREAMLEAKHKKQGDVSRKAEKDCITNERGKPFESPKTELTHKAAHLQEDEMINDAAKQLCRDVIVVAAHEVTVEDGIPIGNIETTTEDKKDLLQHTERGDGDVMFQYTPNKAEPPRIEQNLEVGNSIDSEEILRERARLICMDVISKAVYQVSKENLDNVQNTLKSSVTETLQTNVKANSSERFETVTVTQDQVKQKSCKEEQKMLKNLQKAKKKEEKELRKYQVETAKMYIKMVDKKYKERNEINAKSLKKEMKQQQKTLKKENKEKKREERNLKKEKKKMANDNKCAALCSEEVINEGIATGKAPQENGNPKLGLFGRLAQIFRCTRKEISH